MRALALFFALFFAPALAAHWELKVSANTTPQLLIHCMQKALKAANYNLVYFSSYQKKGDTLELLLTIDSSKPINKEALIKRLAQDRVQAKESLDASTLLLDFSSASPLASLLLQNGQSTELKRSSTEHFLQIRAKSISLENSSLWQPRVLCLDSQMQLLAELVEGPTYAADFALPKGTKYLIIGDLQRNDNMKKGLLISAF